MSDHDYLKDKHILIVKPPLMARMQSSIEGMEEAIDLINLYNCHNIICDFRGLNVDFSIMTAITRPKMWRQLGLPQGIKIARLFDKIDDNINMQGNTMFSSGFHVTLWAPGNKFRTNKNNRFLKFWKIFLEKLAQILLLVYVEQPYSINMVSLFIKD